MHHQEHGLFGLLGIVNVVNKILPNHLVVSALQNLANNAQEVHNFYDRVRSYMIAKEIEGSMANNYLKKLGLHQGEYEWADAGGLISNYVPIMLYLLFKSINPATRNGVFNLKYEIYKSDLSKFGNNVKYLLDGMYSN